MTSSITWRRWRGTSCGRGLRKKSLDSNQRKSASTASPPLRRSPPCRPGEPGLAPPARRLQEDGVSAEEDRKSTRLNSSHGYISYAVFCLKKKKTHTTESFSESTVYVIVQCRPRVP